MLINIHPDNPDKRKIQLLAEALRKDAIIIYPTDTIYGIGCSIHSKAAIEKICRIKQIPVNKAKLAFICKDLSDISQYTKTINTPTFRLLKSLTPGPYTFIFTASKEVPKLLKSKKDEVGIRVPDHPICQALIEELGHPIISTSIPMDEDVEYFTDPEIIYEAFSNQVDYVIDGGIGSIIPSTVIDFTSGEAVLVRMGAGEFEE